MVVVVKAGVVVVVVVVGAGVVVVVVVGAGVVVVVVVGAGVVVVVVVGAGVVVVAVVGTGVVVVVVGSAEHTDNSHSVLLQDHPFFSPLQSSRHPVSKPRDTFHSASNPALVLLLSLLNMI